MVNEDSREYTFRFSIPRDIELIESTRINTKEKQFEVTTELIKRHLVAPGIDAENTTMTIIGNKDMHGNVHRTEFAVTFKLDPNFKIALPDKDSKEFMETSSKFFLSKSIEEINKLIKVHQFVNDKYFVFPISKSDLSEIKIEFAGGGMVMSTPSIKVMKAGPNEELAENSDKVADFFNNNRRIVEPMYYFGYAKQFYDMGLYRIAITEAQAATEYLLDRILVFSLKKRDDDSLKNYEKSKDKADLIDTKLGLYLNLVTGISVEKELKTFKDLKAAVRLRNRIVHGGGDFKYEEAVNAMKSYDELFDFLRRISVALGKMSMTDLLPKHLIEDK